MSTNFAEFSSSLWSLQQSSMLQSALIISDRQQKVRIYIWESSANFVNVDEDQNWTKMGSLRSKSISQIYIPPCKHIVLVPSYKIETIAIIHPRPNLLEFRDQNINMDLIEGFAKIRVYDVCLYTSVKVFLQIFNKAYEISFDRSS